MAGGLALVLGGCASGTGKMVSQIEKAHGVAAYRAHEAVTGRARVEFGGNTLVDGPMLFDTPVGRSWFGMADGGTFGFDGSEAWVSPAENELMAARFHALTWPYFVAIASKLDDPGVNLEPMGKLPLREGQELGAVRVTFDPDTGDAPDDWYIIYQNEDGRIAAMAYIVTYGKRAEEAEKEPHVAVYEQYQQADGAVLPQKLVFYNWRIDAGITGEPIGVFEFTDARLTDADESQFAKPADARVDPLPGS
jgi:hypothetical protein